MKNPALGGADTLRIVCSVFCLGRVVKCVCKTLQHIFDIARGFGCGKCADLLCGALHFVIKIVFVEHYETFTRCYVIEHQTDAPGFTRATSTLLRDTEISSRLHNCRFVENQS